MKKEHFASCLRKEMMDVHVSPQLRDRVLDQQQHREKFEGRRLTAALIMILLLGILSAAAIAAVSYPGILDFAARYSDGEVPENAQAYVQTDVLTFENEMFRAQMRELYYDGYVLRMTVDVMPGEKQILLLGETMKLAPDISGDNIAAYAVDAWFQEEWNEEGYRDMDSILNEDGTLTLYLQEEYSVAKAVRRGHIRLSLTPWQVSTGSDRILLETPLEVRTEEFRQTVLVSIETKTYESAGIRVEEILVEQMPHEIRVTISGSIVHEDVYESLGREMQFEMIDPSLLAESPYAQRLKSGFSGSSSMTRFGDRFVQHETLAKNELHEVYTLRLYDPRSGKRGEAQSFAMRERTQKSR